MIRRVLGWGALLCLVLYVSNNPQKAGKNGANIINECIETGSGLIDGVVSFIGAINF